jgi:hypothetical protein
MEHQENEVINNMSNLAFKKSDWNGPKEVQTPNIKEDISNLLGDDILIKWEKSTDKKLKEKIVRVVEKLDFISHLKSIAKIVERKSKRTRKGNWIHFECNFLGHNYGGLQFDIEALIYYLYLSCIDAIQSQPTQSDEYGPTKNFKKAFIKDISSGLQDKICVSLIFVKAENGTITKQSLEAWNKRNKKEKLKKIADKLYGLRCSYTHRNIRSFLPLDDLNSIPDLNGEYLLCKKGTQMDKLLEDVIKELVLKML